MENCHYLTRGARISEVSFLLEISLKLKDKKTPTESQKMGVLRACTFVAEKKKRRQGLLQLLYHPERDVIFFSHQENIQNNDNIHVVFVFWVDELE